MTKRHCRQHGFAGAKKLMREYGSRSLDGRTSAAKTLQRWREAAVEDLGGPEVISAMQATLIDEASKLKMLLHGVDTWLLSRIGRPSIRESARCGGWCATPCRSNLDQYVRPLFETRCWCECVFRPIPNTDSEAKRTPIPDIPRPV